VLFSKLGLSSLEKLLALSGRELTLRALVGRDHSFRDPMLPMALGGRDQSICDSSLPVRVEVVISFPEFVRESSMPLIYGVLISFLALSSDEECVEAESSPGMRVKSGKNTRDATRM
jgi:hypothetical protein